MTSETPNEGTPGTAKLRRPHPPQADAQERMEAGLEAVTAGVQSQGSPEDQTRQTTDDAVDLPFEGTTRRMSKAELAAVVRKVEDAEKMKALAEKVIERAGSVQDLVRAISDAPDDVKAIFQEVRKDPKLLRKLKEQRGTDMFDEPTAPAPTSELLDRLQKQEELLMRHNEVLLEVGRARAQQSLHQQIDEAMTQFRVFDIQGAEELTAMARENILLRKAADPGADVSGLVAQAAAKQAAILQRNVQQQVKGLGPVLNPGTPAPTRPKYTGRDLGKGIIAAQLAKEIGLTP